MALTLSRNLSGQLMPVRNPLIARINAEHYVTTQPTESRIEIIFRPPLLDQDAIFFTIDGTSFTLYIDYQESLSGGNDYETIWSGYGTTYNATLFQDQYQQRLSTIPFLYQNFEIAKGNINIFGWFRIIFKARKPGAVLNASFALGNWMETPIITNGQTLATADNYLINADLYMGRGLPAQHLVDKLYAYPVIPPAPDEAFGTLHLDTIINKAILKEATTAITEIFPRLNPEYSPNFLWPTILRFNHFLRAVTVKFWETYGEPAIDRPIHSETFFAISAGLAPSELLSFNQSTLLRRWLTNRPMAKETTRAADDFIYFATWKDDTIPIQIWLKAYRENTLAVNALVFDVVDISSNESASRHYQIWQLSTNFYRHELADLDNPDAITHYSFQMVNKTTGNPIGQAYTLILTDAQPDYNLPFADLVLAKSFDHYSYRIWFLNSFNTWENLTAEVPFEKSLQTSGEEFERSRTWENFNREIEAQFQNEEPEVRSTYKASTGYKDSKLNMSLGEELLRSSHVILEDGARRIPISIRRESFKIWNDLDFLHEISFEFAVAHSRKVHDKW